MKTKKIIAYKSLTRDMKRMFLSLYGTYYEDSIIEFRDPRDNKLYKAVALETDDFYYLVIVDRDLRKSIPILSNDDETLLLLDNNQESEGMSFYFG